LTLRPESVSTIHTFGGTILGSSRGPHDIGEMVDHLEELGVDILFLIGGDGTLRGGAAINAELRRRGLPKSVIGIPKTIDNDIMFIDKSFGFETAFAEAVKVVSAVHVEAGGALNGIGLVKLMGRHSGFIACFATLAAQHVDFCLIPEVPFELEGSRGLLEALRHHIGQRKQAVIVVAEGAGQDLMQVGDEKDASGNPRFGDIGLFLKEKITEFFAGRRMGINLKYVDPSYLIRSVPASPQDNVYCTRLAQAAVHAGMSGRTNMLVGRWHGSFVHIPFDLVTHGRRRVDPNSDLWLSVLETTGQPARMREA
jgi:6-phosphofructokinase 1